MSGTSTYLRRAKKALSQRCNRPLDNKGYLASPEENLIDGVEYSAISGDLKRGDGNELKSKFRAAHSSSALAVNCFGPFKTSPERLRLFGESGAASVEFEKPFRIFRGGRAPNLDVWIDRSSTAVAVESKCLEYFTPKRASFSSAYDRLAPPRTAACWWSLYETAKHGADQHFDCGQLIKHYFGLCAFRQRNPDVAMTLLYLFWEPLNWADVDVCVRHRQEVAHFASAVSGATISFRWLTYNELWRDWAQVPSLGDHAQRLMARYQVEV